ncbi:hypothetical protein [Ktedonobacter racemifer]|uniref:hypothetical protein n=1 Tax=Ktedonobacter racemifer TaxID=363277 RepID=UPI001FCC2291|nr:hypothetical protein [Ktedonobacter racemifer]
MNGKEHERQTIPENERVESSQTVETVREQAQTSTSPNCTFSGELVPIDLKRFTDSGINLVECPRLQEECVRSPQTRASSGSKHTPERRAADAFDRETLVGHRKNRLGRGWRVTNEKGNERCAQTFHHH